MGTIKDMIMKKITFKKEHHKYIVLTVLSLITGFIEALGSYFTHSHTLEISVTHMFFHLVFFGSLAILSYVYDRRKEIITNEGKIEKILAWVTIGLVILLAIFRVHEIMEQGFGALAIQNVHALRWFLIAVIALVVIQWRVLHSDAGDATCEALCHGSEGHLLMDVLGFSALFIGSFLGSMLGSWVDIILAGVSACVLLWTIYKILHNLNRKHGKSIQ